MQIYSYNDVYKGISTRKKAYMYYYTDVEYRYERYIVDLCIKKDQACQFPIQIRIENFSVHGIQSLFCS